MKERSVVATIAVPLAPFVITLDAIEANFCPKTEVLAQVFGNSFEVKLAEENA